MNVNEIIAGNFFCSVERLKNYRIGKSIGCRVFGLVWFGLDGCDVLSAHFCLRLSAIDVKHANNRSSPSSYFSVQLLLLFKCCFYLFFGSARHTHTAIFVPCNVGVTQMKMLVKCLDLTL